MKKITFLSVFCLLFTVSLSAQVIFQEDFTNGLTDWTTLDLDGNIPADNVSFITDGWNVLDKNGPDGNFGGPAGDMAAMSTSWYTPAGTSNDWLISPQITLTTNNQVVYEVKAQDPDFPDGYELRISTTGTDPADFTDVLFSIAEEYSPPADETDLYKTRRFNLSDYDGEDVYLAWVNNSTDMFMLIVDNVVVEVAPDCQAPLGLEVTNITDNSADISWSEEVSATSGYEVTVYNAGDDPASDTPVFEDTAVPAGTTTVAATGLVAITDYDVYVYSLCASGTSDPEMAEFTTLATPPDNDECVDATALTVGMVFDDNAITASNLEGTGSTTMPAPECGAFDSNSSSDVWFTVEVPASGNVIIETQQDTNTSSDIADTAIEAYSGTDCTDLTAIECNDDNEITGGAFSYLYLTNQTVGETIYVRAWGYLDGQGEFLISAYEPACPAPTDITFDNYTANSVDISWTENGSATEWEIIYGEAGFDPETGGTTINDDDALGETISGLVEGVGYEVYVRATCSATDSSTWTGPAAFGIPPANDTLCNAIMLTIDQTCSGDAYSNINATIEANEPSGSCWFSSDLASNSVWFSFEAPSSGEVTLTTDIEPNDLSDTQLAVYTVGDCTDMTSLTEIACDEDGGEIIGLSSVVLLENLTPGEIYYVQADGYGSSQGTFCIEAREGVLATDNFTEATFGYYPNPTKGLLNIESSKQVETIQVFNLLGQQVLQTAPKTTNPAVDMNGLQAGVYLVKATIGNNVKTFKVVKQ